MIAKPFEVTILVELLPYQFMSPARWIETKCILFTHYMFERFIEIGPLPTLTGMATLKAEYEVYYYFEDEAEASDPSAEAPKVDKMPICKSTKCFVGGWSTMQNGILATSSSSSPLQELSFAIGPVPFSGFIFEYTSHLVSRLVGDKVPGGFDMFPIKA
ncbi:hypothetical protein L226DRAFT_569004 [Lentinus tigrinus ALCF2SS1-7]|uniref:uncharacterized protein n=1 Tax=Lentinus tigrinus ALCF2SS1-7 TaxID=1328758 RepID=UPI0011663FD9|nr:hypothetical protein L226DRAFT_569004 [Lentinus tigrinus ALCF2SS1-7]